MRYGGRELREEFAADASVKSAHGRRRVASASEGL